MPSAPIMWSAGTRTSSKTTSVVLELRIPILSSCLPTDTPGRSRSTMNREMPCLPLEGSVEQVTVYRSDTPPLVMKVLPPVMTYSSPSLTALVLQLPASEPD